MSASQNLNLLRTMKSLRIPALSLMLVVGCEHGAEATPDNFSHFAAVGSDLHRDARELELLADKIESVESKLEQRKTDIAGHVYADEHEQRWRELVAALQPSVAPPTGTNTPSPSTPEDGSTPAAPAAALGDTALAIVSLHHRVFTPLQIGDHSLHHDFEYSWWLDELGLQSADGRVDDVASNIEQDRLLDECRAPLDGARRAQACTTLLTQYTTPEHFDEVKRERLGALDLTLEQLSLIRAQFEDEATQRRTSAETVMGAYGSSFDGLILWGFPALIAAVIALVLFGGRRSKIDSNSARTDMLALVTVLLLVSAIIILGLGGKIQPEALGTLIGGISGYVLGKAAPTSLTGNEPKPADGMPLPAAVSAPEPASTAAPASAPTPTPMADSASATQSTATVTDESSLKVTNNGTTLT
jgi:hypothetical protein